MLGSKSVCFAFLESMNSMANGTVILEDSGVEETNNFSNASEFVLFRLQQ
jgi:hypothetical protein